MITDETIKLAKSNIDRKTAYSYFSNILHFRSFAIGLAIGLTICAVLLIAMF